jgi:hypothetical protein
MVSDCAFRRLFSDGLAVARVDIGMITARSHLPGQWLIQAAQNHLSCSVTVPQSTRTPGHTCALCDLGGPLAILYADATTAAQHSVAQELVCAAEPVLLFQTSCDEVDSLPNEMRPVGIPDCRQGTLSFCWIPIRGREIGCWLLREDAPGPGIARALRVGLLRIHTEYQVLLELVRLVANGIVPDNDTVMKHINTKLRQLNKTHYRGLSQSPVVQALSAYDVLMPHEKALLLRKISGIRRQVRIRIQAFAKAQPESSMKQKVLFLVANPVGTAQLDLAEESREIDQKIWEAEFRGSLELVPKFAARPEDLLRYLDRYRPEIVHFSGHGSKNEEIVFLDQQGRPAGVTKAALKQLFSTVKDNIRLVVLNACFSRPQAEAITQVIDCAIGMKRAIGDKAAIVFAATFYRAIGNGSSIDRAFQEGKTELMLQKIPEEDTPELLARAGVDPKNVFLVRAEGLPRV